MEAMSHQISGRLEQAEFLYREILQTQPGHAAANHCLGMLYVQLQRPAAGLPHLLASLEANLQNPDYWLGYLEALFANGQLDDATSALSLGRRHGLDGAAVEEFDRRLTARILPETPKKPRAPSGPPATSDRAARRRESRKAGKLERELLDMLTAGNFADARPAARRLTERFSDRGLGWKALGALQWADGRTDLALAAMETAVALLPQDPEALANLGALLTKLERAEEAEVHLKKALQIAPDLAMAYVPLGDAYQIQGRYAEAEAAFRRAVSLPYPRADWHEDMRHTSFLFMLSHNPAIDADTLFAEHCKFGKSLEGIAHSRRERLNTPDPGRRLNVGMVSGDLFNHPVATFIEPVLEAIGGKDCMELTAYYNHVTEDVVTDRLRRCFDHWRPIFALSDEQLERQIVDDGIDILIDLSGHTSRNRLRAFARKPAPVQLSWIGYPGTTGLAAMDYYLTDPQWLPPGQFDAQFTEKLIYLPATAPYQPPPASPPVNDLPALRTGMLTFGSFNRIGKVNASTVRLWSTLLLAVPTAKMLVAAIASGAQQSRLLALFTAHGIAPTRLMFRRLGNMEDYLAMHHEVDICLDTHPYNGGTTTTHALWMGVPTLSLGGKMPAGRQGAAILCMAGLDEFVAADAADFITKGRDWAGRLDELAKLRSEIRGRLQNSASRDPNLIPAAFERALRMAWHRWCIGLGAESFVVTASGL